MVLTMARNDEDTIQNIEFGGGPVSSEQAQRFQDLLISRRKQRFGTQMEAAKGAGVSQTLISTLERGPHTGMRVLDLFKVLQAYGVEPNEVASILGYYVPSAAGSPRITRLVKDLEHLAPDKQTKALDLIDIVLRGIGD